MDLSKSLKLLESQDSRSYEDARRAIIIQLESGHGIKQLVQYYSEQRSERALELLCLVREPNEKILLDQLADIFPRQTLNTTILLGQIIQRAPIWVSKVATHHIFKVISLHFVKYRSSRIVVEDIAVLLFICALLPVCCNVPDSFLKMTCQTFITACELLRQRMRSDAHAPQDDAESVHFSHLHYAVREFFMTLYGVYPNHFTIFLKEYFSDGGEERQRVYRAIVKPMTTLVRYHPNLLEMNKKHENTKDRWHQKESHDFLDECRKVMIGAIPMSSDIGEEAPSEQEDTSTVMSDIYRTLFPSKSSNSIDVWDHATNEEDESGPLMARLDTPPGTRSHTPMNKDQRNLDEPMVLDGKRRRSTGPSEVGGERTGRKSFRQTLGKIFTRSTNRVNETFHEETGTSVVMDGTRRNSELEEAEDAMDAIDVDRVQTPHAEQSNSSTLVSPASIAAAAAAKKAEEARAAVRSQRGSIRATPQKGLSRPVPSATTPTASIPPMGGLIVTVPAAAASSAVPSPSTPAASEGGDHGGVSRSRSTSFLITNSTTAPAKIGSSGTRPSATHLSLEEEENIEQATATSENLSSNDGILRNDVIGAMGGISESLPEPRFVNSFFMKFNRQRFRSECPPADEVAGGGRIEGIEDWLLEKRLHEGLKDTESGLMSNTSTLKRTTSCPNLMEEITMMTGSVSGGERAGLKVTADGVEEQSRKQYKKINLVECFPYLALLGKPSSKFFTNLEDGLEEDHEKNRETYMKASAEFHAKLKELNMADRLPGKIYDDLGHILKGLPVEKQRDMLCARLSLVNQHLLYERSCRLLHANRNRRLFGRIKQQKVYETELFTFRENFAKDLEEKKEMIKAMTDLRKQLISQRHRYEEREQKFKEAIAAKAEKADQLARQLDEKDLREKAAIVEKEKYRIVHDSILRRAEDAEVALKMVEDKFESARTECSRVHELSEELDKLRDDLTIAERRRREETGGAASPDWTNEDRVRELEGGLERCRGEIERLRREMELLTITKREKEESLKSETSKSLEMRARLDRAARLLNDQKEAAEQKYLSLQLIVRRQEEHVMDLYARVEDAEYKKRLAEAQLRGEKKRRKESSSEREEMEEEMRERDEEEEDGRGEGGGGGGDEGGRRSGMESSKSYGDSSPADSVKSPQRRRVMPDMFVAEEIPASFFVADPLWSDVDAEGKEAGEEEFVLPLDEI